MSQTSQVVASESKTEVDSIPAPSTIEKEEVKDDIVSVEEPDRIIVGWEEGEKENPHNWSRLKRWYITIMASVLILNATFASSAPSGIMAPLSKHFSLSHEVGVLTISLFVLGFALGPLLWGPLSEHFGRKPIFIISFTCYTLFQVGNALARNTASLLVFRLLGGIFAAAPIANSGALIGDIWDAKTRGKALAFFTLAPFAGPAIGPTISGFIAVSGVNWRWLFWLLTIFAGACLAGIIFTIPETYGPVLLRRKAERLRRETNDPRYVAPTELGSVSFKERAKNVLLTPFTLFFHEPMLIAITAYISFVYGTIYLLLQSYPIVFMRGHGMNAGISGLMLLNLPVGGATGVAFYILVMNRRYERAIQVHAPHPVPPEVRLEMLAVAAPLFAISFFWFGWTSYPSISFVSPLISGVVMGFSICLVFLGLTNYIVDAYLPVAASALAAMTFFRSLAGAGFPLFATQMYDALNPRWASTLLGLVAAVMVPLPFVLIKIGPRLRKNSKYAPSRPAPPKLASPEKESTPDTSQAHIEV